MWSAPRSLSTVLLYSFAQHSQCAYFDEPFLLSYLKKYNPLGLEGASQYFNSDLADSEVRYASLFLPTPGKPFRYVKNMAFQWIGMNDSWQDSMIHGFLIREPKKMIASYLRICSSCSAADFALDKLWEIYGRANSSGQKPPPVIDADDLLKNPEIFLRALCKIFEMPFESNMLEWEAGPLEGALDLPTTWYADVLSSTCYKAHDPKREFIDLAPEYQSVADEMLPYYENFYQRRLTLEKAKQLITPKHLVSLSNET